jgi:hypothetical protein
MSRPRSQFTRNQLISYLEHLSNYTKAAFPGLHCQLLVHGGAVVLLNDQLYQLAGSNPNLTTNDVDFLQEASLKEMAWKFGMQLDHTKALFQKCVQQTAVDLGLDKGWLNGDAEGYVPLTVNS